MTIAQNRGQVLTFYSYKGGTGRTMALANIACVLAQREANRVLMIDFDLEAPGLHRYFPEVLQRLNRGAMELMETLFVETDGLDREEEPSREKRLLSIITDLDIEQHVRQTRHERLSLMSAGDFDNDYGRRVAAFDWERFYIRTPELMRLLAEKLGTAYTHILVDSRTGLNDISGLCTAVWPEKLVVVFTPNEQNLSGAVEMVQQAVSHRRQSDDLRPLFVYPIPSRIENAEPTERDLWRLGNDAFRGYQQRFEQSLSNAYALTSCDLTAYFDDVQFQHVPFYSYGEKIAVELERSRDVLSLASAYDRFVEWLESDLPPWAATGTETISKHGAAVVKSRETLSLRPGNKVYLASTAQDLVVYRKVADDTILRMSLDAVVSERFGPLPGEPAAECERKASESDLLVCIVAHRYGFVPDKGRGSITRREVEAATAAGRKVLVWIVADDYPWTEKKEQDLLTDPTVLSDPARVTEVAAGIQALLDFKAWLRASFVCESFTTPDDLRRKIAITLGAHVRQQIERQPPVPIRNEIRIIHALQPAPHFHGREELVQDLGEWVSDLTSPDRVWSLVAAGGTGKTAVVERVIAGMKAGEANVLVWSFYERPDADAFLRECNHLFLGEDEGPAGGRLERLERGLRDGRPHLIVLDGLERVQEDAGDGRVRGELSDHSLKLLLQAMAAGLGRARALVTSRYPLVDLEPWTNRGYRGTFLDDLSPEAAVAVLRGWGVSGDDGALRAAAAKVGYHALSVAVLGSYLRSFAGGDIEAVNEFDLDAVKGDDPRAAKLAQVLAFYAERLPVEERELLARLSVFPRGVTLDLLGMLVDAGGEVAGLLLKAKPRLVALLGSLRARGLVFQYQSDETVTWTAHPFLRERFRELLGVPAEKVFDVVAQALGAGLEKRPHTKPSDPSTLDRYERLIEATRLAGRQQEAFDLYWHELGNYQHLGQVLGEYERGYRILAAFSATGSPEDLGVTMPSLRRSLLANDLSLFTRQLGRLAEARAIRRLDDSWRKSLHKAAETSIGFQHSSELARTLGKLGEARLLAAEALNEAEVARNDSEKINSLVLRAIAVHALGDIAAARADFAAATELEGEPLYSLRGSQQVRHHLDLGDLAAARTLAAHGLGKAHAYGWNHEIPLFGALLARIDLAEGRNPTSHIDEIRVWTSRTGAMEWIIESHLLAARHLLARGDPQSALGEAETGLLHAVACGYGLRRIELLVTLARIWLAWPDPPKAIQAAREALDLATQPDCGYAWGGADAAQIWGEAYFANGEFALAQRAFTRALEVRRRIEHPGVSETERWLALTV